MTPRIQTASRPTSQPAPATGLPTRHGALPAWDVGELPAPPRYGIRAMRVSRES